MKHKTHLGDDENQVTVNRAVLYDAYIHVCLSMAYTPCLQHSEATCMCDDLKEVVPSQHGLGALPIATLQSPEDVSRTFGASCRAPGQI